MIKYVDTLVSFTEVPDEISLCISLSNCPNSCVGCHSPHLRKDIGKNLTLAEVNTLVRNNEGISCVCLLGDTKDIRELFRLAKEIKIKHTIKLAWYSGSNYIPINLIEGLEVFDYLKIGEYDEVKGPLNSPTTNQKMFKIEDITYKFRRNETQD